MHDTLGLVCLSGFIGSDDLQSCPVDLFNLGLMWWNQINGPERPEWKQKSSDRGG